MDKFTDEERSMIARYVREDGSRFEALAKYCIYIAPSAAFAVYGICKTDFLAVTVAYAALLIAVLTGWGYQSRSSATFRSALRKCLERLAELEGRTAREAAVD